MYFTEEFQRMKIIDMKRLFFVVAIAIIASTSMMSQVLDGDWTGNLELGGGRNLKLVLHIDEASNVTMDSPDQGAYDLKCQANYLKGDSISFSIPSLMMSYEGRVVNDELKGSFKQGGFKADLSFMRGLKKANRPQTPQPPFPYSQEDVKIENASAGVVLSGTLVYPENHTAETPIVVLVSGSGSQNRDEELFEHKPFAVIADVLARNGIASLRYDDRGFGESTGISVNATTEDYASDTESVIDWIRMTKHFGKVGVIGHSEGGLIAYMLGARNGAPDFIISVAGPAVAGSEILDYQNKIALMKLGLPEQQAIQQAVTARERIEKDPDMKWMQYFLKYDPSKDIKALTVPTFIIYGEKDSQVPPSLNYEAARTLAPGAVVKNYPGLNHMMQHAKTGDVDEYKEIEETFSPEVLSDIVSFIKHNTK